MIKFLAEVDHEHTDQMMANFGMAKFMKIDVGMIKSPSCRSIASTRAPPEQACWATAVR
jgi:hypothetical protein